MVATMSQTSQPHVLSALVASFGSFDAAHGFAVNVFVVIALAALGIAFLTGDRRVVRAAVTPASLHGKVVLLTFLDPVCVSDCPLITQEFRAAGQLLGPDARQVELVAIVINPMYYSLAYTRAFDQQENLTTVPDWRYLTGSPAQLEKIWRAYGVTGQVSPAGAMVAHSDIAFVIDRSGHIRQEFDADPGPGTASTKSSFAVLLADAARQTLRKP
jgi:peroxiredoxin